VTDRQGGAAPRSQRREEIAMSELAGPTETFWVARGGAVLAGTRWSDRGTPMVLLHPGVGDSRIWQWCAPSWARDGFEVVAYDRRGFGDTRYEAEPYDDLEDLAAILAVGVAREPAVLVGNSRGAELAMACALASPRSVSALVLIAPVVSGYDVSDWPTSAGEAELDESIAAAAEAGDLDLVNRLETHYWLDGADQPDGRVSGVPRTMFMAMNGKALRAAATGDATAHPPIWPRLSGVTCPVLVAVGRHDLPGIVRQCHQLADALPDATCVEIDDAAHCPSLDQPLALSALVTTFASGLGR
jgi:pimeloyl-ACP methyl ester carboxylesterase